MSGEMIFTEAGSRKIAIPIVDDDLDEVDEPFVVRATEGNDVYEQTWLYTAGVRIVDNDPSDAEGPPATTATAPAAGRRSSSSADAKSTPGSNGGDAARGRSATASATRTPVDELQPGSGFELTNEAAPEPAPGRDGGGGASAAWLALGLGAAALSAGAIVLARRRLRWSPSRV